MKQIFTILIGFTLIISSCQKEKITLGANVSETFYLQNKGASMRVQVEGNTASKVIMLVVHGGPGASAYPYNNKYISDLIEPKYAVAYWDQRTAGGSQGNSTDNFNLETMVEDLKKVILLLKKRYGADVSIFIMGHSFGGMPTSGFVVNTENQKLIKGWIFACASHNYKLNDSSTYNRLIFFANDQISKGKNVAEWQKILDYCNGIKLPLTFEQSIATNTMANQTLNYFTEFSNQSSITIAKEVGLNNNGAIISTFINLYLSQKAEINKQLWNTEFSSQLHKVTIPVMTMSGYYDLTCPTALVNDVYNRVSSINKEKWESPKAGHNIMDEGNDPLFFCEKVNTFIEKYK
jgi:pimeloyl-ACP methyl ester carboxylesterase